MGLGEYPAHQIESVGTPRMGQFRLRRIFRRKRRNRLGIDVRRIGENEIIPAAAEAGEQIGANELYAVFEVILPHVGPGHGQGIGRYFARVNLRFLEPQRCQNGQAARTRAQVQDGSNARRRRRYAFEIAGQEFADIRARHDHPLVDIERLPLDPSLIGEVGCGLARGDAPLDDLLQGLPFAHQKAAIHPRLELVWRQMQRMQDEKCRLVERRRGAMAIDQPGCIETTDGETQPVA